MRSGVRGDVRHFHSHTINPNSSRLVRTIPDHAGVAPWREGHGLATGIRYIFQSASAMDPREVRRDATDLLRSVVRRAARYSGRLRRDAGLRAGNPDAVARPPARARGGL